jgi:hypothetical protein
MPALTRLVRELRSELNEALTTSTLSRPQLQEFAARAGLLVMRALADDGHPLNTILSEMWCILSEPKKEDEHSKPQKLIPDRGLHEFMPEAGFEHLQLLLHVAVGSTQSRDLAARLGMTIGELRKNAAEGAEVGVYRWTYFEFGHRLHEALGRIEYFEPPLPVRLDGRIATSLADGRQVRLSLQEARMLEMLIKDLDRDVPYSDFNQAGIKYPKKVKGELVKKLHVIEIELLIFSSTQSYRLASRT